jgi:hypothetical protein
VLHLAVAERLKADPGLLDAARVRVGSWLRDGTVAPAYASAWQDMLDGPAEALYAALAEASERMHDLRQVSPFAGVLDARTRWRLHAETSARNQR